MTDSGTSPVDLNGGYVLVHVLEVVVPGRELGDCPACEVALGEIAVGCPVPSTLQSENVALATGGDAEPVVRVRAFDSRRREVGVVIVPVNTLVPLEVWNVWYAMDEGEEEPEERPPEETSKMHLLLQYVSREASAEESSQLREMRSQDFLLRALQQLNASLEAKVMEHQRVQVSHEHVNASTSSGVSGPSLHRPESSGNDRGPYSVTPAAATPSSIPASTPNGIGYNSQQPSVEATLVAGVVATGSGGCSLASAPAIYLPTAAATMGDAASGDNSSEAVGNVAVGSKDRFVQRSQVEELIRTRVEPYERVIAALEEKQRFYDDQEMHVRSLTKSLEELEIANHALQTKLREVSRKSLAEVEVERECARRTDSEKAGLQQQVVELQQEIVLRKAHEDSLQKRVAVMESELSVVHQKCMLVDTIEEEAQKLRRDMAGQKEARRQLQEQNDDMARQVARLQEEACQIHEDHTRELEKSANRLLEEQQNSERQRQALQALQDAARDSDAESRLQGERIEEYKRQISTLDAEIASFRAMHEREKSHRLELEQRLSEQELGKLNACLDEYRQGLRALEDEVSKSRQDSLDERGRLNMVNTELARVRKELAQEKRVGAESRAALAGVEELRLEARTLQERNDELRAQVKSTQEETRRLIEHYEQMLQERGRAEQFLSAERDARQQEISDLRSEVGRCQVQMREFQAEQERLERSLASAREVAERAEDLQRQLQVAQERVRDFHSNREMVHKELEQLSGKFRDHTFSQDRRSAELETALEDRNNEIKLLMYRVQELSSKYTPVRSDPIDQTLSKWVNGYRPAVPFFRLAQGLYLFGRRQVICKISNDKPVFRVGGGFIGFDKFLELYASEELERLLSYEVDDRTGEPKFAEALRVRQGMEESGLIEELRDRVEVPARGKVSNEIGLNAVETSVRPTPGVRRLSPSAHHGGVSANRRSG